MSRGFLPISKIHDEESGFEEEAADNLSPWMSQLANSLAGQGQGQGQGQPTAVDEARKRHAKAQSIVYQVNNLMSNPPRYATVDDAVQDMRERTGLNEYIKSISSAEDKKKSLNKKNAKDLVSIINDSIRNNDDNNDDIDININNYDNKTFDVKIPEVLKSYPKDTQDSIIAYIKNTIENSHGMGTTIPQLQYDVQSVFESSCGITSKDVGNPDFAEFLSSLIFDAESKLSPQISNLNIGTGVGLKEDGESASDNSDYFAFANPAT